jgi:hypothetical protein
MTTTTDKKIQSSTRRRISCGLVLVASFAIQSIATSSGVALADGGRQLDLAGR